MSSSQPDCCLPDVFSFGTPSVHLEPTRQRCEAIKSLRTSWFVVPVLHLLVSGFSHRCLLRCSPFLPPALYQGIVLAHNWHKDNKATITTQIKAHQNASAAALQSTERR